MTSIFRLIYLSKYLEFTISGGVQDSDIDRVVWWKGWDGFRVEVGRGMEGCIRKRRESRRDDQYSQCDQLTHPGSGLAKTSTTSMGFPSGLILTKSNTKDLFCSSFVDLSQVLLADNST